MTNPDVNGPTILIDSSLLLMLCLLHLRNSRAPNASEMTCSQTIRWVFSKWNPDDIAFAYSRSCHVDPSDVTNLLRACCGAGPLKEVHVNTLPGGALGQAWREQFKIQHVTRHLALLKEPAKLQTRQSLNETSSQSFLAQSSDQVASFAARKLTLDLFLPKMTALQDMCTLWSKKVADGGLLIHPEMVHSLFSTCITLVLMLPLLKEIKDPDISTLEGSLKALTDASFKAVTRVVDNSSFFSALIRAIRPHLPTLTAEGLRSLRYDQPELLDLIRKLNEAVHQRYANMRNEMSHDFMDLDDDFESQKGGLISQLEEVIAPRLIEEVGFRSYSFQLETEVRLQIIKFACHSRETLKELPTSFTDYLIAMPDSNILACRDALIELFQSQIRFRDSGIIEIVEKVGSIMSQSSYDCCEVALTTCIDTINGLLPVWKSDKSDLAAMVGDMYFHIVKNGLKMNMLSSSAQISLAKLLLRLIEEMPDYADRLSLASCQSTLLHIQQKGDMAVKFYIGQRLPEMVGFFVLKSHDDIFNSVMETLPTSADFIEGIAYRLYVLSELACHWSTLLRRCIYHIFETPGMIPNSANYAKRGLEKVSQALNLTSPQDLFGLFAPQILYTWFPVNNVDDMPFSIFGFNSLYDLLMACREEASGILIMRGEEATFEEFAARVNMTPKQLILENFGKIIAYSVANGIAKQRSRVNRDSNASDSGVYDGPKTQSKGELYLRKVLGDQTFLVSVYSGFADAVSILMDIFDQEDPVEVSFVSGLEYAANIMAQIKAYSHSSVLIPPNQQPLFKGKHLVRQLNHLCTLTPKYDVFTMWTPPLVVYVARRLINTIYPALGSFHACSVLRKLRVLVCLCGDVALQYHPLEMLLFSLRPFMTDPECADDAMGLAQYLLVKGIEYLKSVPSFLAGFGLSTLASLRVFLESSQFSTTDKYQFHETLKKTQAFHSWLSTYLTSYLDLGEFAEEAQKEAFQIITQSAARICSSGNAEKGTHESNLLLEILRDEQRQRQVLSESARNLALGLLGGNFKLPESSAVDIISTDDDAVKFAAVVCKTCKTSSMSKSKEYLSWAGQVAGRSFAASGTVPKIFLYESRLPEYEKVSPDFVGSDKALLVLLQELSSSEVSFTAGLAEGAIRRIVSDAGSTADDTLSKVCEEALSKSLYWSSHWKEYYAPSSETPEVNPKLDPLAFSAEAIERANWIQRMALNLCLCAADKVVISAVAPVVKNVRGFAEQAFPFILHLTLLSQYDTGQVIKKTFSDAIRIWFNSPVSKESRDNISLILNAILYLRTQQPPNGVSMVDRMQWLDVDPNIAAQMAVECGMHKSALMFLEGTTLKSVSTSRSSSSFAVPQPQDAPSQELLLSIFENIDDPDAYYGISQASSLSSALARMEYEGDGAKSLALRGAQYDSHLRKRDPLASQDGQALVAVLGSLGLSGVASSILQNQSNNVASKESLDSTFQIARRLEQWNLPVPVASTSSSATIYKVFQGLYQATEVDIARSYIQDGFSETMSLVASKENNSATTLREHLRSLAVLTELDDVLNMTRSTDLSSLPSDFYRRKTWMRSGRYDDVSNILSCRQTTFGLLSQLPLLRNIVNISASDARKFEVHSLLLSSEIYRFHKAKQESLNLSTSLSALASPCNKLGLNIDAAIKVEVANSLWDHDEMLSSIGILQTLSRDSNSLKTQSIPISLADVLSRLGHQVSVARLENPDEIQKNYLEPALRELKGRSEGKDAGKVFHQFAIFCDEQLQNPDMLEDLERLKELEKGKAEEVEQFEMLIANTRDANSKRRYQAHQGRARRFHMLDKMELQRLEDARTEFLRLGVENYLLSLIASDEHNNDALRFAALWLERSDDDSINAAAFKHLSKVPTRKFATLMNQLSSRLQDLSNTFQELLTDLVKRICIEHPYHGMYHIWSGTKSRANKRDSVAVSRITATHQVAKYIETHPSMASVWQAIDRTSQSYDLFAAEPTDKHKTGAKIALKSSKTSLRLIQSLNKYRIPPPTMHLEVRADRNYSQVPLVEFLEPYMRIAGGNSAPKVITAIGTDGKRYKQLVKGGNDDLRQDAIMEQVFAAVSSLLKRHRATQQRNLSIRTYKVLPLTPTSGIIEFVANTIPLHDFLMPAHQRYYPSDYKSNHCRKEISLVDSKSVDVRVKVFRKITANFRPVMRFFFMEHFMDPDDWFARRLAYTRTTAAISIVGHILGLGDRHGHNILLDTATGEVVHIDLGVAFELGRVLPIPEVVPFRMTRDIVDGMGITKTEGVFRRSCEFTLDALREETYSIMTILDVLRYDPLYSWSMSPVRMAKLQDAKKEEVDKDAADIGADGRRKNGLVSEASEADRALAIVRKKLSKTLSVTATVNDLINQATDDRNLAVLFAGWGAYA
ncbi:Serine/threonine-protein kinase tel1 [Ceratocystis fimbriata CBS 114723]|uniref:Serine/threonine-protein kinase TEL1 n=1 Tax=Ceratocystis fimbriata CBS 114723 TaxID=1035309 RepID=A0A2C5WWP6_9PEZI|nr:Serine/threonine-protein kinase tel1 [Ceratocystis fimbriata CBS 114723]